MQSTTNTTRQSVTMPSHVAERVREIATERRVSVSHAIVDLVEVALESMEEERRRFAELVDRLAESDDPEEQERLKAELARRTFGE